MTVQRVAVGIVAVEVPCPKCGTLEVIAVGLSGVLTTPSDDTPTLKVRAKSKPLEHWCGQGGLDLFAASGVVTGEKGNDATS